jgi:ABC-type dipeptide/oligopeptide/nickel transport system ATPase subunit
MTDKQKQNNINGFLAATRRHIQTLIDDIPRLHRSLAGRHANLEPVKLLEKMPLQIIEAQELPLVATAFCGPSGAGKSTIFNLVTQLKVPAGGAVRPMTHASLVASPAQVAKDIDLIRLFPGFQLEPMQTVGDLRNPASPADRLFYSTYPHAPGNKGLWVCLIDIPDFNTTHRENWEKAEQMIERADSVIFTVYNEAYKSQKTFDILRRVLKLSGSVTYLLTKIDPTNCRENAEAIRNDLIACARQDTEFHVKRSDGESLVEFLEGAPFYYSAYDNDLTIDKILPLANCSEGFFDHIFGQQGLATILKRQLQTIAAGREICEMTCESARNLQQNTARKIERCDELLQQAAARIAGNEFPIFAILEMISRILEENRPNIIKRLFLPLSKLGSGLRRVYDSIRNLLVTPAKTDGLHQRSEVERQRMQAEIDRLVEEWRRLYSSEELPYEQCRNLAESMGSSELPPVGNAWESHVEEEMRRYLQQNPNLWIWLDVIKELIKGASAGLIAADIVIDGGIGTMGTLALIGGAGALGGMLSEVKDANKRWVDERRNSYFVHLRDKLARPLFLDQLLNIAEDLQPEIIGRCETACNELKEISAKNGTL